MSRYTFINPNGFTANLDNERTDREGKPIYDIRIHHKDPFMVYDSKTGNIYIFHDRYSDLASVPRVVQVFRGMESWRWRRSAIPHDEVYRHGALCTIDGKTVEFTRADADAMLASLIIAEGAIADKRKLSYVTAPLYWIGVWFGGWYSFKTKEKIR